MTVCLLGHNEKLLDNGINNHFCCLLKQVGSKKLMYQKYLTKKYILLTDHNKNNNTKNLLLKKMDYNSTMTY